MSRARLLPDSAWATAGDALEARLPAPATGHLVVWAEGWGAAGGASLGCGDAPPVPLMAFGTQAFASVPVVAGDAMRLRAASRPARCLVLGLPQPRHSPTLAAAWPRALARPHARRGLDLAECRARMERALAAQDLDAALAAVADMLLAAREDPATLAAIAALLAHLARHPLCRGTGLGAFAAALAG